MAPKKITRKQLLKEPDEFLTVSSKLIRFSVEYNKQISLALSVLFVLIVVVLGIRYFSNKAEDNAFAMLEKAVAKYESILKDKDPNMAYREVENDFQRILKKYSGKKGGDLAKVTYANICYNAGDYDKAIELFHTTMDDFDKNPALEDLILIGLAYSYKERKDYKTATQYFEMLVSRPDSIMKDEALFHLGWLYAEIGEPDRSNDAYKKILSDFTDSIYFDLVREKVAG
jgi:tetratricopeptide (TPR) repeat protein